MIGGILNRLKAKKLRTAPQRVRLSVEPLEARENPAGPNMWLGGLPGHSGDFSDPYNWGLGRTPISSDRILFDGVSGGTANCVFPITSSPAAYHGLEFRNGYNSTVNFSSPIFFTTVFMHCGNVLQSADATLSITNLIEWTAGNLHTGSVGEFIYLMPGAEGIASPANGGEVGLGSTFTLLGGSTLGSQLNMYEGRFNINNGDGFVVEDHSLVNFYAPVPKTVYNDAAIWVDDKRAPIKDGPLVEVKAGGTATAYREPGQVSGIPKVVLEGQKPKLMNRGTVVLTEQTVLQFKVNAGQGTECGYKQRGVNAVTKVEAGCQFVCGGKTYVDILDGRFELAERPGSTAQNTIIISAPLAAGALELGMQATLKRADENPTIPLKLKVDGTVYSVGTIEMYAKRSANENDKIEASGKIVLWTDSTLRVKWFENDNGQPRPVEDEWTLMKSELPGANGQDAPIVNNSGLGQPGGGVTLTARLRLTNTELRVERTE